MNENIIKAMVIGLIFLLVVGLWCLMTTLCAKARQEKRNNTVTNEKEQGGKK